MRFVDGCDYRVRPSRRRSAEQFGSSALTELRQPTVIMERDLESSPQPLNSFNVKVRPRHFKIVLVPRARSGQQLDLTADNRDPDALLTITPSGAIVTRSSRLKYHRVPSTVSVKMSNSPADEPACS
jgi:hypothetical protein